MKKSNPASKLIVSLIVLAAGILIGFLTGIFTGLDTVFEGFKINPASILRVLVMAALVLSVQYIIQFILHLFHPESGRAQTMQSILSNVLRYAAWILILCWGLSILGADVGTIIAGVGIIALVVGFAANSVIADMVTGVFMIFENQYNVGDYIEVAGFRGKVTSIGIRTTCLEDAGGNVKIVNNSDMSNILNRSDHTSKAVSVIGVPYDCDLEGLEAKIPAMMDGILERHSDILLSAPVYLGVDELADSSVNLKFVAEVDDKNIFSAGRVLNRELLLCFKKAGVEVPFPQVDVHQK